MEFPLPAEVLAAIMKNVDDPHPWEKACFKVCFGDYIPGNFRCNQEHRRTFDCVHKDTVTDRTTSVTEEPEE